MQCLVFKLPEINSNGLVADRSETLFELYEDMILQNIFIPHRSEIPRKHGFNLGHAQHMRRVKYPTTRNSADWYFLRDAFFHLVMSP